MNAHVSLEIINIIIISGFSIYEHSVFLPHSGMYCSFQCADLSHFLSNLSFNTSCYDIRNIFISISLYVVVHRNKIDLEVLTFYQEILLILKMICIDFIGFFYIDDYVFYN